MLEYVVELDKSYLRQCAMFEFNINKPLFTVFKCSDAIFTILYKSIQNIVELLKKCLQCICEYNYNKSKICNNALQIV